MDKVTVKCSGMHCVTECPHIDRYQCLCVSKACGGISLLCFINTLKSFSPLNSVALKSEIWEQQQNETRELVCICSCDHIWIHVQIPHGKIRIYAAVWLMSLTCTCKLTLLFMVTVTQRRDVYYCFSWAKLTIRPKNKDVGTCHVNIRHLSSIEQVFCGMLIMSKLF